MTFNFFAIVDGADEDESLYPVQSSAGSTYPVHTNTTDGTVAHIPAEDVDMERVGANHRSASPVSLPSKVKWGVLITDSRVIVYCEKYDKGGGWSGSGGAGLAVALASNAVSKARAARRRRGKTLVGQVRYEWLESVSATRRVNWPTSERLRLQVDAGVAGGAPRRLVLQLRLPKHIDACTVAHDIATRAARIRLQDADRIAVEDQSDLRQVANEPKRAVERGASNRCWL